MPNSPNPPLHSKPNGFGICYEAAGHTGCISYRNGRCAYSIVNDVVQAPCNHPNHPRLLDNNPKAPAWDLGSNYNFTHQYVVRGIKDIDASYCCATQVSILVVLALILAFLLSFCNKI